MKLDNFYHLSYSVNCLHLNSYIPNVSADVSSGLLQISSWNSGAYTELRAEPFIQITRVVKLGQSNPWIK